jgi:hypothetical protein
MARSTNPNWTQTAGQICHSAARELGAIGISDTLGGSEMEEMLTRLNSMLAKWSTEMNLWREEMAQLTLLGGTGAATLPAEVQDIRSVRYMESTTYKRPLAEWNRDQWMLLPNRAQVGPPTIYYLSQHSDGDRIYVWPVPAEAQTLELDYNRAYYFAESPDQELDLPSTWHEPVLYGLASRSAGIFGATAINPAAVARCDQQARTTYEQLLDSDRPDSYQFEYDSPVRLWNS